MADDKFVSRLLLIGLAVVILAILITQYMNTNKASKVPAPASSAPLIPSTQLMGTRPGNEYFSQPMAMPLDQASQSRVSQEMNSVMPNESIGNEMYKAVDFSTESKLPAECNPRDKNTVADLLPKDAANSKWAQANPAGTGSVTDQNFLNSGYLAGINTVGQTLKNPNYQLRSDPPIEKQNIGPWQQSTIEYDVNRRFFEIGSC